MRMNRETEHFVVKSSVEARVSWMVVTILEFRGRNTPRDC